MPQEGRNRTFYLFLAAVALLELPLFSGVKFGSAWTWPGILLVAAAALQLAHQGRLCALLDLLQPGLLLAVAAYFTLSWIVLIAVQYFSLQFNCFDTGLFANLMAVFLRTGEYRSSILSNHGLGDHFTPVLMLLAPLLRLFPSFLLLPYLKLFAFAVCTLLLYLFSKELISDKRLRLVAPLLWTIHAYANRTLEFEFQPSSLAMPVTIAVMLAARRGQFIRTLALLLLVLGFKEHLALAWICAGIFLWQERGWKKRGALLTGCGVAAGLLIYTIVMPYFAAGVVPAHATRFGPFALLPQKFLLVVKALLSVGFLPLLAPRCMLWILPSFGIAFVSNDPHMLTFSFHYQDLPLSVLFVGVIYGLAALEQRRTWEIVPKSLAGYVGAALLLATLFSNTRYPVRQIVQKWPGREQMQLVSELEQYAAGVRPKQKVWSLDVLCPFLFQSEAVKIMTTGDEPFRDSMPHEAAIAARVDPWPLRPAQLVSLSERLTHGENYRCEQEYSILQVCTRN